VSFKHHKRSSLWNVATGQFKPRPLSAPALTVLHCCDPSRVRRLAEALRNEHGKIRRRTSPRTTLAISVSRHAVGVLARWQVAEPREDEAPILVDDANVHLSTAHCDLERTCG
jgi:hypothetical protein